MVGLLRVPILLMLLMLRVMLMLLLMLWVLLMLHPWGHTLMPLMARRRLH